MDINIKDLSKKNFTIDGGNSDGENIKISAILRIADAAEIMATNYKKLQDDYEYMRRDRDRYRKCHQDELNKNRTLRGVITKLKNKLKNI